MGFYSEDSDKITYQKADELVDRFLRQEGSRRAVIKTRDICSKMDVKDSMHNKKRINDALKKYCKETTGNRFNVPEKYG